MGTKKLPILKIYSIKKSMPEKRELMKEEINKTKYNKGAVLTTLILGLVWFSLLVFISVTDPIILALKHFTRVKNGSFVHELLVKEIEGVHLSATLFNITNAQEFLDGTDYVLKVKEVGPFTYREWRSNVDVEIDEEAELVRYTPNIRLEFVPEESIARPEDILVTVPNIPMLGMISKMSDYNFVTRYGFNQMTTMLSSKPIITLDANNYLWGYEEPLVSIGHKLIPGSVHFDKMGILDRLYDTRNRVEVSIADADKYMVKRVNGHEKLNMGNNGDPEKCELCNNFENAYEGIGFQPGSSKPFPIRLFKNGLCRILDLEYNGTKTTNYGGTAFVYRFSDSFFTLDRNEDSNGVLALPDCFFGLPLAISKAHFQDCDPAVYERIEGVRPEPEKFDGWVAIDPRIGMALETKFAIQLNLVVKDVSTNAQAKSFSNMVLPICLIKIEQPPLPQESDVFLTGVYGTGPKILLATQIILAILTIVSWGYCLRAAYVNYFAEDKTVMSFPLKIPVKEINANNLEAPPMIESQKELLMDDSCTN